MLHNLLLNVSFHQQLLRIDQEFMREVRSQGCQFCSGPLYQANYPRVGFGVPKIMRHFYEMRFGLCCGQCRRRTTPQSVRFLGPRRFVAFVMVLISAQRTRPGERRIEHLGTLFGIRFSLSTWQRWRTWWKEHFPASCVWREARGLFVHHDDIIAFPRDLLNQLTGDRLLNFLLLISPLNFQVN
jgi:hypothetical protein